MKEKYIVNSKNKYREIKKRKTFLILLILCAISLICGILFLAFLDKNGKQITVNTITSFFKELSTKPNKDLIINTLKNNILITIIMWLLGVSLFGVIFELLFLAIKSFTLGFSITSFIYTFKFKGIYLSILYLFPSIFNLIIYFILGFFATNYSIYLFNYLFKNKEHNLKLLMKKYIKVLLISMILLFISSIIEIFIVPYILKLFTKTLF